jgi:hypothetical protein
VNVAKEVAPQPTTAVLRLLQLSAQVLDLNAQALPL